MQKILEKVERRLGEHLFLKGERCSGPKCALTRRPSVPGMHGKKRRRRGGSEFGKLLSEKQKVRFLYGLDDHDIERYVEKAAGASGVFSSNFLRMLESRLDNVVFRTGMVESRRIARQLVRHGHVLVNGRRASIPSMRIRKGDVISFKERILASPVFVHLESRLKKYEAPRWITLNKERREALIVDVPDVDELAVSHDATKIKEFYSR